MEDSETNLLEDDEAVDITYDVINQLVDLQETFDSLDMLESSTFAQRTSFLGKSVIKELVKDMILVAKTHKQFALAEKLRNEFYKRATSIS